MEQVWGRVGSLYLLTLWVELNPDGVGLVGDVVRAHLCDSNHKNTNTH